MALISRSLFILLLIVGFAMEAKADTIAVASPGSPVDLSSGGAVYAPISRVASTDARQAVGQVLRGSYKIEPGAGGGSVVKFFWDELQTADGQFSTRFSPRLTTSVSPGGGTELSGSVQLRIEGNMATLIKAAKDLQNKVASASGDAEGDDDEESGEDGDEVASSSSGDSTGLGAAGSQPFSNELGQLPTIAVEPEPTDTTTTVYEDVYGVTTEGCEPEYDADANEMAIMERQTKNGDPVGDLCTDSLRRLEVKTSYVGCGYDKDLTEEIAYAMARRYYVNGANTTYIDDECERDEELAFAITSREGDCGLDIDLVDDTVSQMTELYYLGRSNEVNLVGTCEVRDGATSFAVEYREEECDLRDDWTEGRTYVREMATYVGADGLRRAVGTCQDTDTYYAHVKDTDPRACPPYPDYEANLLYKQFRWRIDTPRGPNWRTTECQIDTDAVVDLHETIVGCEAIHFDYDGYSNGARRILRKDTDGEVRGCVEADVSYEHQYETESWQHDDANLQAFPKEVTFIVLPEPAGKTIISAAIVRDGAEPTAYSYKDSTTEPGNAIYLDDFSCDKYVEAVKTDNYERPDGTVYGHAAGFGDPTGPSNGCRVTNYPSTWVLKGQSHGFGSCSYTASCGGRDGNRTCTKSGWRGIRTGQYEGQYEVTRDDGNVVVSATDRQAMTCSTTGCGANQNQFAGGCQGAVSGSTAETWNASRQWYFY